MKRWKKCVLLVVVLSLLLVLPCAAVSNEGNSYTYDYWGDAESCPDLYTSRQVFRAEDSGLLPFKEPQDLFVDRAHDNTVYVADTGRNRIVVYTADFQLIRVIETLQGPNGEEKLDQPMGVFVDADGYLYIADQGNKRAVRVDENNTIVAQYLQPKGDIAFEGVDFLPVNVLADSNDFVYVLCDGLLEGAAVYTQDGLFEGYYGANTVEMTFAVMFNNFWKKFLNATQRAKIERSVPDEVTNFDIDDKNFIYTCTEISQTNKQQLKKFNPVSVNVLRKSETIESAYQGMFGDLKVSYTKGKAVRSSFVDICCDAAGYVYGLDFTWGRIFMYTPSGELVGAFGGLAEREGYFRKVVALDDMGDDLVVLDSGKNDITVLERTNFTKTIVDAQSAYKAGDYDRARGLWEEVLKADRHLQIAVNGIGKVLYNCGEYVDAMSYFREGNDRANYEKAFQHYRSDVIRLVFPYMLTVLAIVAVGVAVLIVVRKRKRGPAVIDYGPRKHAYIRYILSHPTDGFDNLREQKHTVLLYTVFVLLMFFAGQVVTRQLTGFIFNYNDFTQLNLLTEFSKSILVFILWVVCHWAVSALFVGRATPREIWTVSAVALTPYVAGMWINVLLSNVLLATESMFMTILQWFCILWSVWILLSGLISYQEFSFGKTLLTIFFTLLAMLIVVFVLILLFSLFQQVANFIMAIARETLLRVQ